ncbi:OV-16 antigen [Caerostris darwini]|uniref:OV-16 antigen n=1 Tax=Caerostris darwini TaxID=1538125 RepID=A0AAV4W8H9_9ARAC|nr:OV-16 antigen [Caerostris darwini]
MEIFQIFLLAAISVIGYRCDCDLSDYKKGKIVPGIIPKAPEMPIQVFYKNKSIECGSKVNSLSIRRTPTLNYTCDDDKLYTIIMIDVDELTPQKPILSPYRLWLVANIPGCNVSEGDTHTKYFVPIRSSQPDPHRYIMMIYEQPRRITFQKESSNKSELQEFINRQKFDLNGFVQDKHLQGPIFGYFLYVIFA